MKAPIVLGSTVLALFSVVSIAFAASTIGNNITTEGTLSVTGASTLTGAATLSSTLSVTGGTTLVGATSTNLAVSGRATTSELWITGTGALNVLTTATSTFTRGGLSVSGGGFASDQGLTISGGKLEATGIAATLGPTNLTTLSASGAVTLSSTLSVTSLATLSGGLLVNTSSSTITHLSGIFSTTTQATSTTLAVTGRATTSGLYVTNTFEFQGIATTTFARGGLSVSGGGLASSQGLTLSGGQLEATNIAAVLGPTTITNLTLTAGTSTSLAVTGRATTTALYVSNSLITGIASVGIATSSPGQEVGIAGDVLITSAATTTLNLFSTSGTAGSCLQLRAPNGLRYRLYVNDSAALVTEAGDCQ